MLDLAKPSRNGGRQARFCQIEHLHAQSGQTKGERGWCWQRRGLQVARLSFAKSSTCVLDLAKPRVKGGGAGRNRGSQARFAKLRWRSRWVVRACRSERAWPGFAKLSARVLDLAKLRAKGREKLRWKDRACRNERSKPPPHCVKMKNTTARGHTPFRHVEMGRTQ